MPFINNKQYLEILSAKKDGDPKAIAIIDKYIHNGSQDDLDRMVKDFYSPSEIQENINEPTVDPAGEEAMAENEAISEPEAQEELIVPEATCCHDISGDLDKELDGLIDESEIPSISFEDFLKNKKKNALREKKNSEYFKAFDFDGRQKYLDDKKKSFNDKFNLNRRDIDRSFRDMDNALNIYSQNVGDMVEDDVKLDTSVADEAYNDIVDIGSKSHSFGRGWDEMDSEEIKKALSELVLKYGKKNVQAALNVIKGDNAAYRDHRNNQIDNAIGEYSKSLDKLLK